MSKEKNKKETIKQKDQKEQNNLHHDQKCQECCGCEKTKHKTPNNSTINLDANEEQDNLQKIIIQIQQENNQLKEELSQINKKFAHDKSKYQADLINFQKRMEKEKNSTLKYASMNFINDILTPLEQLDKVLEMSTTEEPLLKNFLLGFQMINNQIKDILRKNGVQEIKALDEKFNPQFHCAVEKTADRNKPNGVNISVLQKGFLYKDLVLQPSMVKVNEWSDEDVRKNEKNK